MKKDILIIAHFTDDLDNKGNGRFNYIAELLNSMQIDVELVTSDFSHDKKKKRDTLIVGTNYKVTFIPEPIYSKNISLKRFYSHFAMSTNLKKYLKGRDIPDAIYCSIPSLDVAKVVEEYAKENNIKLIIDIQDLWPEAFKMVFNVPLISNLLFYPMHRKADCIYRAADEIIAVSETYLDIALQSNKKSKNARNVFLGTELDFFDKLAHLKINKPEGEVWLAYIGTLGHSYEIEMVINALSILEGKGIDNIKFIVMGDGPLKSKFENYAQNQKIWAEFTGRLDYEKMVGLLASCDIAINPIKARSVGSIINKVGDYAAAGLPVINTQECKEYRNLIDEYQVGFNCKSGDANDVADKILVLVKNQKLREEMGRNNRRLAEERFDRKKTYQKIIELIVNLTTKY